LRQISGTSISAKTFRTWGGTVSAIELATEAEKLCSQNPRKNLRTAVVGLVAARLNNTVSVCRKYYGKCEFGSNEHGCR